MKCVYKATGVVVNVPNEEHAAVLLANGFEPLGAPPAQAAAEPPAPDLTELTNAELKAMAEGLGVEVPGKANKAALIALIEGAA